MSLIPAVSKDEADGADTQREKIKGINFVIPFHMPFFRSNSFVGRAETLKQVHEYFSDSNLVDTPRIFALIGTGGMGKTQTALEWLLIVDNADDLETFSIEEYLPNQGSGAIFTTSRRPEFSQSAKQVGLEGLDSKSAVALLLNLAHLTDSGVLENEAMTLVEKLGFMPLAISHAGCYIHETKLPLRNYLPYYNKAFMALQSRKPRFGWNYRNDTAATTWEISFSKVEERHKEAALLLLVCSYLNPEEIFDNMWEDELLDNVEIKNKILLLASYSLVKIICFGVFFVYPVVHSWARERSGQPECFKAIRHAVMILGKASQRGDVSRDSNEWEARKERRVAFYLDKYDEAMQWYKRALAGYEKTLGKDHPSTLSTIHNIAVVFDNQGKYDEAMYKRALAGKEKVLGKDHPSTLDTVHNIAVIFDNQGRYDEAMQ
ncbi:hypothetical protein TWF594_009120 [Orbilia oligospora]|nr:hypothetical protein TWF594_009120 [Orbilia oligospora]